MFFIYLLFIIIIIILLITTTCQQSSGQGYYLTECRDIQLPLEYLTLVEYEEVMHWVLEEEVLTEIISSRYGETVILIPIMLQQNNNTNISQFSTATICA